MNDALITAAAKAGYEAMTASYQTHEPQVHWSLADHPWEEQSEKLRQDWRDVASAMLKVLKEAPCSYPQTP